MPTRSFRPSSSEEGTIVFRLNEEMGSGPEIVRAVFMERGWTEYNEAVHSSWNLWWKSGRFRATDYSNLQPWQRINHHPSPKGGNMCITSKDGLLRNMRRLQGVHGVSLYNFAPPAFHLPREERLFKEEFSRLQQDKDQRHTNYWIYKPTDQSRGRGIFVFNQLQDLRYAEKSVVQRYLNNPFLISNYKFDLRVYVTVASYQPLVIYVYKDGIARFSTERFDLTNLDNIFAHLTNTSINKYGPSYNTEKVGVGAGCKWTFQQLRYHLYQRNINDRTLWTQIVAIVILTIISQSNMPASHNCFELFGFDIIFDEDLKPWLLEVNFSPALTYDCAVDLQVKKRMLHDLCDLISFHEDDVYRGNWRTKSMSSTSTNGRSRRPIKLPPLCTRLRTSLSRPRLTPSSLNNSAGVRNNPRCDSGVSSVGEAGRDGSSSQLNLESIAEDDPPGRRRKRESKGYNRNVKTAPLFSGTRTKSCNRNTKSTPLLRGSHIKSRKSSLFPTVSSCTLDRPVIRTNRASYLRSRSLSRQFNFERAGAERRARRTSAPDTKPASALPFECPSIRLLSRKDLGGGGGPPPRSNSKTFSVRHDGDGRGGTLYKSFPDGRQCDQNDSDFEDGESEREVSSRLGIVGLAHATAAEASGMGLDGQPPDNPLYGPTSVRPVTDLPKRFGDYHLVLPFNATTRKAVQTGDEKVLVREIQRLLRHRQREQREGKVLDDPDIFDVVDPWPRFESR